MKPCMMCNHPCPNTPCGVKAPCPNCGWPYPHGSCADRTPPNPATNELPYA